MKCFRKSDHFISWTWCKGFHQKNRISETWSYHRWSTQARIGPRYRSNLPAAARTDGAQRQKVCVECVWLEAACSRPEHEPHRVWSCIQKLFCSLPGLTLSLRQQNRFLSFHARKKCFWTIYVIKDKNNSVNKAKIQEYAIGINLFKAVY